jgi:hypothetical protein
MITHPPRGARGMVVVVVVVVVAMVHRWVVLHHRLLRR